LLFPTERGLLRGFSRWSFLWRNQARPAYFETTPPASATISLEPRFVTCHAAIERPLHDGGSLPTGDGTTLVVRRRLFSRVALRMV